MKYSIIVPVYNRPDEVDELLASLLHQEEKDFEVIVVEDGSQVPCGDVCQHYAGQMELRYQGGISPDIGQRRGGAPWIPEGYQ